jgi:hypothetical protein
LLPLGFRGLSKVKNGDIWKKLSNYMVNRRIHDYRGKWLKHFNRICSDRLTLALHMKQRKIDIYRENIQNTSIM